jgi:DNA-binding GntR family transcriptional regulator
MPQMTATSMKVKTLEAQAYELMREKIITGEWPQGTHLKDNEIAAPLGISATPVREALRKLASEGLVETIPYRGTFVATLTAAQVKDISSVRLGLEWMAIEAGLNLGAEAEFDRMEAAIREFERALTANNLPALLEWDMAFHSLLVHCSQNDVLEELYHQLTGRLQMLMAIADMRGRLARGNDEHWEILRALRARDLHAGRSAIYKHLLETRDCLLAALSGTSNGSSRTKSILV